MGVATQPLSTGRHGRHGRCVSDAMGRDPAVLARSVGRRMACAHMVAGAIGAFDVFVLLWFVLPAPPHAAPPETVQTVNTIAFVVFMAIGGAAASAWGTAWFRPIERWVAADRPPSPAERQLTLAVPLRCSIINATGWLSATVVFAAVNLTFSAALAMHVAQVILLGGVTCVALGYLLSERLMRPITALALSSGPVKPRRPGVGGRLVLTWLAASGVPLLGLVLLGGWSVTTPDDVTADQVAWSTMALAGAGLAVGLLGTALVAKSLAEPLGALRTAMTRMEEGDLAARVAVDDGSEVGLLQSRFNAMAAGLEERARLRDLFGRHVGEDVVRSALDSDGMQLGGEVRDVAVLFADLVGSTAMAAARPPTEVVQILNDFFTVVVEVAAAQGGWVNKFEGDGALVVFGAPTAHADAPTAALRAARELNRRMDDMPLRAGIGVSAGRAVAGNVGAEARFEYTVIGDPVNEAARLCDLAKQRSECVLASGAALDRADPTERATWSGYDELVLRGRPEPTRIATPAA